MECNGQCMYTKVGKSLTEHSETCQIDGVSSRSFLLIGHMVVMGALS